MNKFCIDVEQYLDFGSSSQHFIIYYVNPRVLSLTYFKDYIGGVVRFDVNVFFPLSRHSHSSIRNLRLTGCWLGCVVDLSEVEMFPAELLSSSLPPLP